MTYLYLDDIRTPPSNKWIIVRSFDEFKAYIEGNPLPDYISLDHDLGDELTGYDAIKWLCNYSMDNNISLKDIVFTVHSANPIGRENIENYINNFLKFNK